MAKLIGNAPNQVPTNADLGSMAFEDKKNYATISSSIHQPYRNLIINGDMSIAQRGTSTSGITGDGYYTADRWRTLPVSLGTWTQSQSTDVPSGQGFAKSLKMECTTADASPSASSQLRILQLFEGQNLQYLKKGTANAQSLTLSFWVKSNKTGTYIAEFFDLDSNRTISQAYTINSANTWEKKTLTYAGDNSGLLNNDNNASFQISFWLGAGSTYTSGTLQNYWLTSTPNANRAVGQVNLADSTSNEWYITGVQLEAGTTASDFEFLPHDVNLRRCQRYYYLHVSGASKHICLGTFYTSTLLTMGLQFPTEMRTAPTLIKNSGTNYYIAYSNNSGDAFDDFTGSIQRPSTTGCGIDTNDGTKLNGVQGYGVSVATLDANSYIAFNAEL